VYSDWQYTQIVYILCSVTVCTVAFVQSCSVIKIVQDVRCFMNVDANVTPGDPKLGFLQHVSTAVLSAVD